MGEERRKKDVEILPSSYEPTKAEKEEVFIVNALPETLAKAITKPVNICRKDVSKHKAERSKKDLELGRFSALLYIIPKSSLPYGALT